MKWKVLSGNCQNLLKNLPSESINCCVTSPPYWGLRDYQASDQLGLESTPEEYVQNLASIFCEVKRILTNDGTLWLNLGDTYYGGGNNLGNTKDLSAKQKSNRGTGLVSKTGFRSLLERHPLLKPKDLVGIPWKVAFALQSLGWYLRCDIIWSKPNSMPESVKDRPTRSHEYIFLMSKSDQYYYDIDSIREPLKESSIKRGGYGRKEKHKWKDGDGLHSPHSLSQTVDPIQNFYHPLGKNKRSVWTVSPQSAKNPHFATFPEKLISPCVIAGCPIGGTVLDPFCGSGTTGVIALKHQRDFIGMELNPKYVELARSKIIWDAPLLNHVAEDLIASGTVL